MIQNGLVYNVRFERQINVILLGVECLETIPSGSLIERFTRYLRHQLR
jgi:hypothetical protein